jgi:hypothetical protein
LERMEVKSSSSAVARPGRSAQDAGAVRPNRVHWLWRVVHLAWHPRLVVTPQWLQSTVAIGEGILGVVVYSC